MPRRFTASSNQYIEVNAGALAGVHGYGCVAVMFKRASTGGTQNLIWTGTDNNAGSTGLSLDLGGSDNLRMYAHDGGASSVGPAITATDKWYIVVARKGNGTVTASFSVYDMSARTWSHSTGTGSVQNGEGTYNDVKIGSWTTAFDRQDGDIAILGVFRQWVPTDAEVEALGFLTIPAWLEAARRASAGAAVWVLDQFSTSVPVRDITGGGANEEAGTLPSVSTNSGPLLSYGAPVTVVRPGAEPPTTVWMNPTSDVTVNSWTTDSGGTSNLYQSIDENAPADDGDYIRSPEGAASSSYYETQLETISSDAGLSTYHTVSYRIRSSATANTSDMTVSLRQGSGTEIASWAHTDSVPSTFTTYDQGLSGAEADNITYPTDLRIRFAPTADTQTPALVADRGSTQNLTGETSTAVDMAAAGSITTGNYLIARIAVDNTGSGGARPGITSVTDPRSNTWTVGTGGLADPGAASAGTACYIAYAKATNAYTNGDDITFNWTTGSPVAKAIVIEEWSGIHPTSPVAASETQNDSGSAGSTTAFTITSGAATAVGQLVYGVMSAEGPTGDTAPSDADVTALTRLSTTSGTAASNQTVNGAYRVSTAASATTWNATITSRDWAAAMIVFAAAPTRLHVSWAGMSIPEGAPSANAGVAEATGAANNATIRITTNAGEAAATGTANTAPAKVSVVPATAESTGAAHVAALSLATNGGDATGSGAASGPAGSLQVTPATGSATGAANNATVTTAATYYISADDGSDSDNGLTTGTAWATLAKHNGETINSGSIVLLERGNIWRENLVPKAGVTYGAYGAGDKPSIRGSNVAGAWTSEGGNLWYIGSVTVDPNVVAFDDVVGRRRTAKVNLTQQADYWWDDPNDRLYVYSTSDPGGQTVEYGVRQLIVGEYVAASFTLEDLDVRHSRNDPALAFFNPGAVTVAVNRCDFIAHGGYCVQVNGDATVTFDECTFENWGTRRATTADNYAVQAISDCTVDVTDCTFTMNVALTRNDVMAINGDTGAWLRNVTGNTIAGNDSMDEGILVFRPGTHATTITISNNTITDVGGIAIDLNDLEDSGATPTIVISGNLIVNACTANEADTSAIRLADFTSASTVTVHHNIVDGTFDGSNTHHGIRVNASQGATIVNNLVQGTDDGFRLDNGFSIRAPSATAKNNLSTANRGASALVTDSGTFTETYNLWDGTETGFTPDGTDVLTAPTFAPAPYGYYLLNTSAGAFAGTTVGGITTSPAPSMGRYEDPLPNVSVATGTGAGNNASLSLATNGGSASGSGAASGPSGSLSVTPATAEATGAAHNASISTSETADAGVADATGAANNASLSLATNGGSASGSGAASGPSGALQITPATATATGAANNATISTSAGTNVNADVAEASGAANNASISIATNGGTGSSSGAANGGTGTIAATPATATATGAANANTGRVAVNPSTATATGEAHDADATTEAGTTANAGVATASGAAYNATVNITATIGAATATGDGYGPAITLRVSTGTGTGTGSANNPGGYPGLGAITATATGDALIPAKYVVLGSGVATGVGNALDATIGVPPKLLGEVGWAILSDDYAQQVLDDDYSQTVLNDISGSVT